MVKQELVLDHVFSSLSDPTRRDIIKRVANQEMSITEIAQCYDVSMASVSKHITILENAKLIVKHKKGKQHMVAFSPKAFKSAADYLQDYRRFWEEKLDSLEEYLKEVEKNVKRSK
jgi:DNA-binding transcriptional ArsR family regulator